MKFRLTPLLLGIVILPIGAWAQNHMNMEMPMPLNEPTGSGTAWLPTSSPVHDHAFHFQVGEWNLMTHGDVYFRYTRQNANNEDKWSPGTLATVGNSLYPSKERGDDKIDFPNWAMVAADRTIFAEDRLIFRAMMSLDPWTEGREGYPLLFQSGEGLVDRQHAHDLFMELAATYKHHFNKNNHAYLYFGLPGEPALGPVAFMHRPSAWNDPDAPLAHHAQDATHITYGVGTLGWIYKTFKAEGSIFKGEEPDNARWNIEAPEFDSYSLRLTGNLFNAFTVQASGGYLQDTEPDAAGVDLFRGTASLDHNLRFGEDGNWASTAIYGFNTYVHGPHRGMANSVTLESNREFRRMALWGRWESLERLGGELDIPGSENRFLWVHALSAGAGMTVMKAMGMELILGGQGTACMMDKDLEPFYGEWPLSWEVFLNLRPAATRMESKGGHDGMDHRSMGM
jgi:hypothetical protein